MYTETIPFEQDMPVTFDAYKVSHYHLHCHERVVEVLILLRGEARVKVSFEEFDMKEGDYIVINAEDSHSIYASDARCEAASLYFRMLSYKEHIPYLDYVLFTCESFDLVKYKNETQYLRRMIAGLILDLARYRREYRNPEVRENLKKAAEELLWIFVSDYGMKNYYNRNWNQGHKKTEKYYTILKYIFEHFDMKNLMDHISKKEFYSKSYITHLFKQVGATSFQDALTYIRLFKSERLLLDSELPIVEIAERCGFSDVKYYTNNFKKWFLHTPSEYRKLFQPEVAKHSLFQRLRTEDLIEKMENLISTSTDNTQYRAAVTPLTGKSKGAWTRITEDFNEKQPSCGSHQVCIRIDEKGDLRSLPSKLAFYQQQGFIPSLMISYGDIPPEQCDELLTRCCKIFGGGELSAVPEIIISYYDPGDKAAVSLLIQSKDKCSRISLRPMLLT